MSRKQARRILQSIKHGQTVKEFLRLCGDMGFWFDDIQGTELETIYRVLIEREVVA